MLSYILEKLKKIDITLFSATTILSFFSIVTIFGAVDNFGKSKLIMQTAMALLGVLMIILVANVDYKFFVDKLYIPMFAISVILLLVTLLLGTSGVNLDTANKSWLELWPGGLMIQPSEFVKITFICTFSKHISLVKDKINKPIQVLLLTLHAGLVTGLILISGDLGVSLVYFGIIIVKLFCAGMSV